MSFGKLLFVERKIIELLLETAKKEGASKIALHDGEEVSQRRTDDFEKAKDNIGITEETRITFYDGDNRQLGWFWLIHGNREDVISDYNANDWCETVSEMVYAEIEGTD